MFYELVQTTKYRTRYGPERWPLSFGSMVIYGGSRNSAESSYSKKPDSAEQLVVIEWEGASGDEARRTLYYSDTENDQLYLGPRRKGGSFKLAQRFDNHALARTGSFSKPAFHPFALRNGSQSGSGARPSRASNTSL